MPSTLFAPAPVRSVSTLPPLDLGTAGPGRYPTMAELRSFPRPYMTHLPGEQMQQLREIQFQQQQQQQQFQQQQQGQQQGPGSWYSERERRLSAGAGPPTVQGKRERRDSAGPSPGPPTRRAQNVRIVMPTPLSSPPQQQQPQQYQQRQQGAMFVNLPRPRERERENKASALPPTTQPRPRSASRSPPSPSQPAAVPFPSSAQRPLAPPAPATSTLEDDPHARGPFLGEQKGHRILRKRLPSLSLSNPFSSSSPAAPPVQQDAPRRRRFSFGRQAPAPGPAPIPIPPSSRNSHPRDRDREVEAGSPVEIRFGGASVHRYGAYEEEGRRKLRVVNGGPEPPSAVDAQGDVLMRDAGARPAPIATVTLPPAPQPGAPHQPMQLQTSTSGASGARPVIYDILRPEPRYAANHAPVRAVQPQPQPAYNPPPPPPSIAGTNYRSPEPVYPSRAVAYDVPNPYRPPSTQPQPQAQMQQQMQMPPQPQMQMQGQYGTQSAPASVARSTWSLPSSSARSVRGAETDPEMHTRARAAAGGGGPVRSRLLDEAQRDWATVYGDQGQAQGGMGNVRLAGGEHKAHFTYEIIAAAAGFAAMRLWEEHERQQGKQPKHSLAKEVLAALAAAEVERLVETKGLDWLDKEKAKREAAKKADQLAGERYPEGAPGQGQQPQSQGQGQRPQGQPPVEHPPPASSNHSQGQGQPRSSNAAPVRSSLFDESQRDWATVYGDQSSASNAGHSRAAGDHRSHFTYEIIAAAAGFAAMRTWEDHERQQGKQPKHSLAKEILASLASTEIDRLVETKGLDWIDKERAKHDAAQRADKLAQERYPDGPGQAHPQQQHQQQGQYPQQAPVEHSPPGSSDGGRLRAPPQPAHPQYQPSAPSAPASAGSRMSSISSGSRPPITLFVPGANSPWAHRPNGASVSGAQHQQAQHGREGESDMAALREEEARRHVLIKRDYAHRQ